MAQVWLMRSSVPGSRSPGHWPPNSKGHLVGGNPGQVERGLSYTTADTPRPARSGSFGPGTRTKPSVFLHRSVSDSWFPLDAFRGPGALPSSPWVLVICRPICMRVPSSVLLGGLWPHSSWASDAARLLPLGPCLCEHPSGSPNVPHSGAPAPACLPARLEKLPSKLNEGVTEKVGLARRAAVSAHVTSGGGSECRARGTFARKQTAHLLSSAPLWASPWGDMALKILPPKGLKAGFDPSLTPAFALPHHARRECSVCPLCRPPCAT